MKQSSGGKHPYRLHLLLSLHLPAFYVLYKMGKFVRFFTGPWQVRGGGDVLKVSGLYS